MNVKVRLAGLATAAICVAGPSQAAAQTASLVDAARAGDRAAVRALLQKRADVKAASTDGTTALHWAVQRDDAELIDVLIGSGADVKAANRYGVTPLFLACQNGSATAIDRLLKAGADANAANPDGETALMTAARTGKLEAVKMLLAHGADPNAREKWRGQTALMWAAAENHAPVAQALIEARADINARSNGGFTPVLFATRAGRLDVLRTLLAKGANANDAIQPQQPPGAASAQAQAAPPRPTGNAAGAAEPGTADPLTGLFQVFNTGTRSAGRTGPGTTALIMAIMNAHYELAAELLEKGADPNADGPGWTALHQLAWTRRPPIQHGLPPPVQTGAMESLALGRKLLEKGANPNARMTKEPADGARNVLNRIGSTPFLQAAKLADVAYMRLLLEFKADPSLTTTEGTTPMMAAAGVGIWHTGESAGTNEEAFEAVKLCFEVGNDVNAADANGDTPLHGAALRGADAVAQFLVEKGATLNPVNKIGWTPWVIADGVFYPNTYNRQLETAALLLKLGADPKLGKRRDVDLPPTEALAATGASAR